MSVAATSLNVDSLRAAPLQSSAHQTTFIRRADGSTTVRLVVPSAGSASIKAQRAAGERSTKLLVGIVVVFLVCHVVRLVIQVRTSKTIVGLTIRTIVLGREFESRYHLKTRWEDEPFESKKNER